MWMLAEGVAKSAVETMLDIEEAQCPRCSPRGLKLSACRIQCHHTWDVPVSARFSNISYVAKSPIDVDFARHPGPAEETMKSEVDEPRQVAMCPDPGELLAGAGDGVSGEDKIIQYIIALADNDNDEIRPDLWRVFAQSEG